MRFDHILHVCPDPKFYSGAPSPRKLLLESGGIVSNEKTVSVEDEMETPIESEIEKDTILLNAYETFIAPNPIKGDGYFFPRR